LFSPARGTGKGGVDLGALQSDDVPATAPPTSPRELRVLAK
jgi:hypothetical protein